ncbi:transposase [Chryseobacterium sp. Ch-15]|uniref:Transposase n=1 Tax=Chryseobacterium muglaense TaxID=2893752 RepID=A0A9Q3USN0_9FLAO|nr:transposase [Chryseobacterium muglaense]MBD3906062.1 transposase [Chryseobacterium muglaense]MCC9033000.1 transposase [Chryseobacterium muglaense]MCM2556899.1 transposase [Chryseobacterium muglaense]
MLYQVLDKDIIENEVVPNLPKPKPGFLPKAPLVEIVNCILYKLKTGVQWAYLPVKSLFEGYVLSYQNVFYHFRKWCVSNVWQDCWIKLLSKNKSKLDLSSVDLDASHTSALRGGEEVAYQGRKKRKTSTALYFTDRQGLPLAMSDPIAGNHNDGYHIEIYFDQITQTLNKAEIAVEGLFMNADAGFDAQNFRKHCESKDIIANIAFNKRNGSDTDEIYFDEILYHQRYAIERTNAWLDSFRSLLNRFDTTVSSWKSFNYLAFMVIALRKFYTKKKFK